MYYAEKKVPIKTKLIHYILIYLLLASSGGMFGSLIGNDNFVLLRLGISIWFIIVIYKGAIVRNVGVWLILFALISFLTICYSTLSFATVLNICSSILLVYVIIQYDSRNIVVRFLNYGWVICFVSLIVYLIISVVGFETLAPFYTRLYTHALEDYALGNGYGGLIFYRFIPLHSHQNCGPFSEPGEYAIFLMVLLYFSITYGEKYVSKRKNAVFIVLIVANILTCQSTSGYIMLFVVVIVNLFSTQDNFLKNKSFLLIGLFGALLFGSKIVDLYHSAVTNKIVFDGVVDLTQGTGQARYFSILDFVNYVNDNPVRLLGVGFDRLIADGVKKCAGLPLMLLTVGVFSFTELYGYYFLNSFVYRKDNIEFLTEIVIIIIAGLSQPALINPLLFLIGMVKMMQKRQTITIKSLV